MALGEEKHAEVSRFLQTSFTTGVLVLPAIRQCETQHCFTSRLYRYLNSLQFVSTGCSLLKQYLYEHTANTQRLRLVSATVTTAEERHILFKEGNKGTNMNVYLPVFFLLLLLFDFVLYQIKQGQINTRSLITLLIYFLSSC